jgi:hypothetical protein
VTSPVLPPVITDALMAKGLESLAKRLSDWIQAQGLEVIDTGAPTIPTFQVIIPVTPAHPLLTLQPPPNNPDVPTQKMRGAKRSPYANAGARKKLVDSLNAGLPDSEQKGAEARDKMFKIRWQVLADPAVFEHMQRVLDEVIAKIRREFPAAGAA